MTVAAGTGAALAAWILGERDRQRSDDDFATAAMSFIDMIGCAVAGASAPGPSILREVLATSGTGPASVIGSSATAPVHVAAMLNGTAGHALDYDDYELVGNTHPSVTLVPVALALGQELHAPGSTALRAYLVGYEVIHAVGSALGPDDYLAGHHNTGTTGTLGATACACVMLGLDHTSTLMALGIATSLAAGVRANFGTDTKPLHAGHAAGSGVLAALLAAKGFTGSADAIDGDYSFASCHAPSQRHLVHNAVARLQDGGFGISVHRPTLKPYASCGGTHAAISGALRLREEAGDTASIDEIVVDGPAQYADILMHHRPTTGLEAKFSMEGSVALALVDGAAGIRQFSDESVSRKSVADLTDKVVVRSDDHYTERWQAGDGLPANVTISTGGRVLHVDIVDAPGSPRSPMTETQVATKFQECTAALHPTARDNILEVLQKLTVLDDVADLGSLLTTG